MINLFKEMLNTSHEDKLCNLCDRSSVWSRDFGALEKLLENDDVDINYRDEMGMTPLHYAISNRYLKAIDLLLKHNANPRLADKNGLSPLGYAFKLHYQGHTDDSRKIVVQLIKAGILANIMTVKMLISYYQYDEEILTTLLSPERTQQGLNKGHMLDVRMMMKSLRQQNISKETLKLLFSFKPNLQTAHSDQTAKTAQQEKDEIYLVEENIYQTSLKTKKQAGPATAQEIINAIANRKKAFKKA